MPLSEDVVPLPEVMSSCGCRFKPTRHRHNCPVLIAYIETEKTAERVLNQRYQSYTVEFPCTVRVKAGGRVSLDPVAFIREHLDDYLAFVPEYFDDDRVQQFVIDWVINNTEFDLPGGFGRSLVMDDDPDEVEADHGMSGWSHDQTLALHEKLGLNEEGTAVVNAVEPVYDDPEWPVLFEELRRHPPVTREERIEKATRSAIATWKATRRMFPTKRARRLHDQAMAELDRARSC